MAAAGPYPVSAAPSHMQAPFPMRIGFDCAPLVISHSLGIRRVVENTLQALEQRGNLQVVRLMPEPGDRLRAWRRKALAQAVRDQNLQGLHAFQSAFCMGTKVPSVQTVHELSWLHGVKERGSWKQRLWVGLGRRRAQGVVCATRFAAQDYSRAAGSGPKPTVVPWGVASNFQPEPDGQDLDRLQKWSLRDTAFLLSPGGLRPKKRPADLLRALAKVSHSAHVVFTGSLCEHGPRLQALAQELGMADRVHLLQDLPDPELACLYRHARATSVIARSEGFALPVLESLASDTLPLVTANSAQSEVAGKHGLVVEGHDDAALQAALESVLGATPPSNPDGVAHARTFTWDRTAAGIEKLWESLV